MERFIGVLIEHLGGAEGGRSAGPEKIGAKIRRAEVAKVPYQLVIGQQEAEGRKVALGGGRGRLMAVSRRLAGGRRISQYLVANCPIHRQYRT